MIELGGNITLNNFHDRDYAELIVIKKVVGRYARQLSDADPSFSSLTITLETQRTPFKLTGEKRGKEAKSAQITAQNLFVGLDSLLKQLV